MIWVKENTNEEEIYFQIESSLLLMKFLVIFSI